LRITELFLRVQNPNQDQDQDQKRPVEFEGKEKKLKKKVFVLNSDLKKRMRDELIVKKL